MRNTLRNITAIAGKELRGYFSSPVAWVMMGLFAFIFAYFFVVYLNYFVRNSMPVAAASPAAVQIQDDSRSSTLASELDQIFSDPIFARALVAVRVESLPAGAVLYSRNDDKLVLVGFTRSRTSVPRTAATSPPFSTFCGGSPV